MTDFDFEESLKTYCDWAEEKYRSGMNLQYTKTKNGESKTLTIELAPILDAKSAPDWNAKISLQLTPAELCEAASVMFGLAEEVRCSYHGKSRNKGALIKSSRDKGVFFALSENGRKLMHILPSSKQPQVCAFFLRRLAEEWKISVLEVIAILEGLEGRKARMWSDNKVGN